MKVDYVLELQQCWRAAASEKEVVDGEGGECGREDASFEGDDLVAMSVHVRGERVE